MCSFGVYAWFLQLHTLHYLGKLAEQTAGLQKGNEVYLEGRIQSRLYTKKTPEGVQEFTTWEISASKLEAAGMEGE